MTRKRLGITQAEMAARMGVSTAQISRWESGLNDIPRKRIERIIIAYEAKAEDLFDRPSEIISHSKIDSSNTFSDHLTTGHLPRSVPIHKSALGHVDTFTGIAVSQTILHSNEIVGFLPRPALLDGQKGAYGFYVRGSSMSPRYDDGEAIFVQDVRLGPAPMQNDDVVVYLRHFSGASRPNSTVLLKRLIDRTAKFVELQQFDPPARFQIERSRVARIDRVIPWGELLS